MTNDIRYRDAVEAQIEALMEGSERPIGAEIGWLEPNGIGSEQYLEFLESIVPERLDGMKVAVDAAHGAAYKLGPAILRRLGAQVTTTGCEPDGMNINATGGATKPETVQQLTRSSGSDVGVAFDGDAAAEEEFRSARIADGPSAVMRL